MINRKNIAGGKCCFGCSTFSHCFSSSSGEDGEDIGSMMKRGKLHKKGEHAFYQGDYFGGVVIVKAGSFKTYVTDVEGNSQIAGFHLPGELIGVSGLYGGQFQVSAQALETSQICELSIDRLEFLLNDFSTFRARLIALMAREVGCSLKVTSLSNLKADQKLSVFLNEFADRFRVRGSPSQGLRLPMSKTEIANFLGLAPETVSRSFSRVRDNGGVVGSSVFFSE